VLAFANFMRVYVDKRFDSKCDRMRLFTMLNIINSVASERTRERNLHDEILARKELERACERKIKRKA
jgi:hypothetical protein